MIVFALRIAAMISSSPIAAVSSFGIKVVVRGILSLMFPLKHKLSTLLFAGTNCSSPTDLTNEPAVMKKEHENNGNKYARNNKSER